MKLIAKKRCFMHGNNTFRFFIARVGLPALTHACSTQMNETSWISISMS